MAILCVSNQKGGVGKSTTATALSLGLIKKGYRILLIDTDPQCNVSDTYNARIDGITLYDVLINGDLAREAVQHTPMGDIISSDPLLSQSESILNKTGKEYALKKAITPIVKEYDYIIIDTPPSLGILLINALTFADYVIIPITADRYSLQGLSQLNETIVPVREYTNSRLKIAGLLLTRFNMRTKLSQEFVEQMPKIAIELETILFNTKIRDSIAVKEAQSLRCSLYEHAPSNNVSRDYILFINELLGRI